MFMVNRDPRRTMRIEKLSLKGSWLPDKQERTSIIVASCAQKAKTPFQTKGVNWKKEKLGCLALLEQHSNLQAAGSAPIF
jgi:hypothetical protein